MWTLVGSSRVSMSRLNKTSEQRHRKKWILLFWFTRHKGEHYKYRVKCTNYFGLIFRAIFYVEKKKNMVLFLTIEKTLSLTIYLMASSRFILIHQSRFMLIHQHSFIFNQTKKYLRWFSLVIEWLSNHKMKPARLIIISTNSIKQPQILSILNVCYMKYICRLQPTKELHFNESILFIYGAGTWTHGLVHAKHVFYHWALPLAPQKSILNDRFLG